MVFYNNRKKKGRRPARKVVRKRVGKKTTALAIKSMIKRELARNIENKTFQYYNTGQNIYPSNHSSFLASIIPLSPYASYLAIQQSVTQQGRIGNRLKIKKLTFKGTIHANKYDITTNATPAPMHIIFWILLDKTAPTTIPAPTSDFLQLGSSTVSLQNDLMDQWAPVNTDKYRVFAKRLFKIGYSENVGTGGVPNQSYLANNDFKFSQNFSIDVTKYLVKNVNYNDNNATPSTRGLYLMATVVQANGANFSSTTEPAQMQYVLNLDYEDA